jgi:hypothetical protein
MSDRVPEPSELIYEPQASWAPIGALFFLAGLRAWWREGDSEVARMRRHQETGTAVVPAEPIRTGSDS